MDRYEKQDFLQTYGKVSFKGETDSRNLSSNKIMILQICTSLKSCRTLQNKFRILTKTTITTLVLMTLTILIPMKFQTSQMLKTLQRKKILIRNQNSHQAILPNFNLVSAKHIKRRTRLYVLTTRFSSVRTALFSGSIKAMQLWSSLMF